MNRLLVSALSAVSLLTPACAAHSNADRPARVDRTMMTQEQMVEHHFATVYEAVEALHSNWLQTRGTNSMQTPGIVRVYMDNTSLGGVDALRAIPVRSVMYIQYLDAVQATARYGIDHSQGVIFVSTRR